MAVHKIIDDFCDDSFTLVALHSSMEDFAMVYTINSCLKSKFKRSSEDLDLSKNLSFPIFEWKDDSTESYWTLINNKSEYREQSIGHDLFENERSFSKRYLLPEYKEVDYLLKIEHDDYTLEEETLKKLLKIPKIITAYILDADQLKSKNNLIF